MNNGNSSFLSTPFKLSILPNPIPIIMYSIDQTGAKIQLGGLKLGLIKLKYQSDLPALTR